MPTSLGQINDRLRSVVDHHFGHWCPGCEMMHLVPLTWKWDGSIDAPTVTPSLNITGYGEGRPVGGVHHGRCHYVLTKGVLHFCGDCTHSHRGTAVPLPPLPPIHRDDWKPS